jgi:Ser/Thr protein kinase RdoA (MazF antagonist)
MRQQIEDGPLPGGTANRGRVIRVGDSVHRPAGVHTPAVHDLLRHLQAHGFDAAPPVIGRTANTEVLGYLQGEAATDPVPGWALTDSALRSVGGLLRRFHDAGSGFDPSGRRWQRPVPAPWHGPIVTHNDVNPANVIFRDGRAVALIDFDLAAPGAPAFDVAVTACFWAPLRAERDITDGRRGSAVARFRQLLDGYGADFAFRRDVVAASGAANQWIADVIEDNASRGHPAFGRLWQDAMGMHERASHWLTAHVDDLLFASR